MRVDIWMPRLDVAFKKGPVPEARGPVAPIRVHWIKFLESLRDRHAKLGHEVRVIEVPLWQITTDFVQDTSQMADRIYIPHKMRENWWLDERVHYYTQMVIPNIFSIDNKGWCATASSYPIRPDGDADSGVYEMLRARIKGNISKFDQPAHKQTDLEPGYVFFPCQLPHDETIKYHSDVEVADALRGTMEWVRNYNSLVSEIEKRHIVIKGHPVNPGAMVTLRQVYSDMLPEMNGRAHWVDDMSIHQLIDNAKVVVTVNSGVGLEAILHGKSVFTFGRADYDTVTRSCPASLMGDKMPAAMELSYRDLNEEDIHIYKKFIDAWYNTHYDYEDPRTFEKIV